MSDSAADQESAQPVFKAGEFIFRENDPGDVMFIIEKGQVEIVKTIGGEDRRLTLFEPGDFFGEMSILEDLPRGASARAVTDCKLLQIDHSTFDQMLRENPEIGIRMMRSLSRRLREAGSGSVEATPSRTAAAAPSSSPLPDAKPASTAPRPASASAPAPSQPAPTAETKPKPAEPPPVAPPSKPAASTPLPAPAKPPAATPPAAQTKVSAPASEVKGEVKAEAKAEVKAEVKAAPAAKIIEKVSGQVFPLALKPESTVGRPDSVTGILPDIDLSTVDTQRSISRRHAKLIREGTSFFVYEEIGTANGTFVNGERVKTGVKAEVRPGDEVRFGAVITNFHLA